LKTWLPRVTEAPEVAEADGCAADDPAAAVMTLDISAATDAIIVEVVLTAAVVEVALPVV
jgi:hypothetical protein